MLEHGEFYDATIVSCKWDQTRNGKLFLSVVADVCGERIRGSIWATPATTEPRLDESGEPGPSMLDSQLAAIGFTGPRSSAIDIGESINLGGNECRVKIEDNEYNGNTTKRIAGFYAMGSRVDRNKLAELLGGSSGVVSDVGQLDDFSASDNIPF